MTFVITQACIDTKDQSCVDVCPVDCIHFDGDKDRMLYIDPTECIDCGACQPACPVSAIFPESDVPAEMRHFTEINSLWYQDPEAARARVGGAGDTPAPSETQAAPEVQAVPDAERAGGTAAEEQPAASAPEAAAPAATTGSPAATVAVEERVMQVPATTGAAHAPEVSTYNLPSPLGFISLALFALAFVAMFTIPGPQILEIEGIVIGATVLVMAPLAAVFLLLFIISQARDMALFSARHEAPLDHWRQHLSVWRSNEESRRFRLIEAVEAVAAERFAFPNDEYPDLRTYVNVPEPQFGIEPRGTGEKYFPDIITVEYPGNYPVAIAQVETRETVTPEQAMYVWARLENRQCPLYLYVPAGLLREARRHAKLAGLKKVRWRTWRWTPNGMLIREV